MGLTPRTCIYFSTLKFESKEQKSKRLSFDGIYNDILERLVRRIAVNRGYRVDNVHALEHLAERGILAVQMGSILVHDEELACSLQ